MQRITQLFGFVLMLSLSSLLQATPIQTGFELPIVDVQATNSAGELLLDEDESFYYDDWTSTQLTGKARVVFHIAGRTSAREENEALIRAIVAAGLPQNQYQTSVIVNLNDIISGSGFFVRLQARTTKARFPRSSVVLDDEGIVREAWSLQTKSSAVIVLDQAGIVQFFKEGPLTATEIKDVVTIVEGLITV